MDSAEQLAAKYLELSGYTDVLFEPFGPSTFPDFSVDGRIGVEVRRLVQHERHYPQGATPKALKTLREGLRETIVKVLRDHGAPPDGVCWFVNFRFRRPVPDRELVRKHLRRFLSSFRDDAPVAKRSFSLAESVHFSLHRASSILPYHYVLGGFVDRDAGGWIVPELESNLAIAIQDKASRLEANRARFEEWWLVLVDNIGSGDQEKLEVPPHGWDRLILLDPEDPSRAYEP